MLNPTTMGHGGGRIGSIGGGGGDGAIRVMRPACGRWDDERRSREDLGGHDSNTLSARRMASVLDGCAEDSGVASVAFHLVPKLTSRAVG